jgi:Nif-specific regulatory protein
MPLTVGDIGADPQFAQTGLAALSSAAGPFAMIAAPIVTGEDVAGLMLVTRRNAHPEVDAFHDDVRLLTMVTNIVGQAMRLHRLVSQDRERMMSEQRRFEKGLAADVRAPRAPSRKSVVNGVVGQSVSVQAVMDKVRIVAQSGSTVMLRGESGTGKEMFAAAIHELSPRHSKAFVKLNCAALPESVLESELFGHERGAFTGAVSQRK